MRRWTVLTGILWMVFTSLATGQEKTADDKPNAPAAVNCTAVVPAAGQVGTAVQFAATVAATTGGNIHSTDGIVSNLRFIPAGAFVQGSPADEPRRDSNENQFAHVLTRNLAVMESEVTRQMWEDLKKVQSSLPGDPSNGQYSAGPNAPVNQETWSEAILFANLLSVQRGYTRCYYTDSSKAVPISAANYTGGNYYCDFAANGFRLPTEGEWEYFCRAETTGPFWVAEAGYSNSSDQSCNKGLLPALAAVAVYCGNNGSGASTVKSLLPNPWNLWDVHGNVWEWCWDWSGSYPVGTVTNHPGPSSGSYRVLRGGSWYGYPYYCRSAERGSYGPGNRDYATGFRLVRSVN